MREIIRKILREEKHVKNTWKKVDGKLTKKYKFDSFRKVLDFVMKVGAVAEKQNHHPEIKIKYDEVVLSIFDHELNKISDKCHKFADAIEKIK